MVYLIETFAFIYACIYMHICMLIKPLYYKWWTAISSLLNYFSVPFFLHLYMHVDERKAVISFLSNIISVIIYLSNPLHLHMHCDKVCKKERSQMKYGGYLDKWFEQALYLTEYTVHNQNIGP